MTKLLPLTFFSEGMTVQWHGPHLVISHNSREIARLGSVAATADLTGYIAAGPCHVPIVHPTFGDAREYLDKAGNRAPIALWENEL